MLKTNDIKINQIKLEGTEISVTFEDPEVHPAQYTYFKDRLNNYKLYIDSEYSLKTETEYDESSQQLSIEINIIIPNNYLPTDPNKSNKILMDPINTFQIFYDAQNEIYKKKQRSI
jgi:hypothetical protein